MRTKLTIGVRELVEFVLRSGDLKVEFAGARARRHPLHRRSILAAGWLTLRKVAISYPLETPDWVLAIGGRIDGVYEGASVR